MLHSFNKLCSVLIGVQIIKSGIKVTVTTNIGLTVVYNGVYNVFVKVDARYRGKTKGLCGNYNGNPNDDFIKQDGKPAGNANDFGNSWKVDRTCPNPPPVPHPCLSAGSIAKEAKQKCALLQHAPFSSCHKSVHVQPYIQDCEYDVCACKKHPLVCLCEAYAAYATTCLLAGVSVKWKDLSAFHQCCK